MNDKIRNSINAKYIELSKYEEALYMVKNLWLPRCVSELLEKKIKDTKDIILKLERFSKHNP